MIWEVRRFAGSARTPSPKIQFIRFDDRLNLGWQVGWDGETLDQCTGFHNLEGFKKWAREVADCWSGPYPLDPDMVLDEGL